ncbi:MAG: hypothetical protein IT374_26375 [Polyangiaceae bacterium]|nr:hypothetical protein [Polyangiaceae bacterium]
MTSSFTRIRSFAIVVTPSKSLCATLSSGLVSVAPTPAPAWIQPASMSAAVVATRAAVFCAAS